jgi:hypothetical protein
MARPPDSETRGSEERPLVGHQPTVGIDRELTLHFGCRTNLVLHRPNAQATMSGSSARTLPGDRTQELTEQMRAAGVPV